MSNIIAEYAGTEQDRMAQIAATGVRVLSLDGGGVKGLSSAHIIAALEARLDETPLYRYFDLVAGTSTGSIIASSLVYQHMSGAELVVFYRRLCAELFDVSWTSKLTSLLRTGGEYSSAVVDATAQAYFGATLMREVAWPKCAVTATEAIDDRTTPGLFTSYDAAQSSKRSYARDDVAVRDAVRSSSALPFGFEAVQIGSRFYVDGGIWANNPARVALDDALNLFVPGGQNGAVDADLAHLGMLLSIGCGKSPARPSDGKLASHGPKSTALRMFNAIADPEPVHRALLDGGLGDGINYRRLNAIYTERVGATSYDQVAQIERDTLQWIDENAVLLDQVAEKLKRGGERARNRVVVPTSTVDELANQFVPIERTPAGHLLVAE